MRDRSVAGKVHVKLHTRRGRLIGEKGQAHERLELRSYIQKAAESLIRQLITCHQYEAIERELTQAGTEISKRNRGRIFASLPEYIKGGVAMKATDLLKKDHDTVKKMFAAFEKMGERAHQKRHSKAEEICEELRIHAAIEEEIFYPAVRSVKDKQAKFDIEEALQEHKQMKLAIEDILQVEGEEPSFGAKMKVLQEDADEEEKEVFKEARKLGNEKLEELGEQLQERKDELKPQSGGDYENGEERA